MKRIKDMEMKEAQQAFDINLFSQMDLLKLALPKLRAAKGRVIATTSGVTNFPFLDGLPIAGNHIMNKINLIYYHL